MVRPLFFDPVTIATEYEAHIDVEKYDMFDSFSNSS